MLGYQVSPSKRWFRNDNGFRFQRKIKHKAKRYTQYALNMADIDPGVQSWIGHAIHAETAALRESLFSEVVFLG
ncbi:hypothetical protein ACUR5C_08265 [Aliikangiella sp. IMCC44653]